MQRRDFLAATAALGAAAVTGAAGGSAAQPDAAAKPVSGKGRFKLAYAPHFGMFKNHAPDDMDQLAFAADQGFTAWEYNEMKGRGSEFQDKFAKACEKHGIRMGVFVGHTIEWGSPNLTTGKKEAREKFVAEMKDSVEVAKRLNTSFCTVVPGPVANNVPFGIQTANVVEALKQAAAVCEPSGLVMVCEPLNWRDHAGQFLRHSDQAYLIMKAVGSPSCKILFDIYHQQATEGNLIENIGRCWDETPYFQIGDNPGRREPGTGEINYRNVFKYIHDRGFKGILGMEHGNAKGGKEGELALIEAYVKADDF